MAMGQTEGMDEMDTKQTNRAMWLCGFLAALVQNGELRIYDSYGNRCEPGFPDIGQDGTVEIELNTVKNKSSFPKPPKPEGKNK